MIRVLFIGMTSNPGGMETYMMNIFSRLEGHGFHFEFINMENKTLAYSHFIQNNGGVIRHVFIRGSRFEHLTRRYKADVFFSKHHDYDIVHLNTTYLNQIYWIKAAKKYKIKHLIIQSHNCGMDYKSLLFRILNNILTIYNQWYLKHHPTINKLAASANCGTWMFGKDSKFKIISNGINTDKYIPNLYKRQELRLKIGIPLHSKVIITTARLEQQKNYPKIIKVFKEIHHVANDIYLVIVGSGSMSKEIKNMVKIYNLSQYVIFLGQHTKTFIMNILNIADLMLMPSFYEAIPFSLTESQATGVPALVSKEGISKHANITGMVRYLSLNESDKLWAQQALYVLKEPYNFKKRESMNNMVRKSNYNLDIVINNIKAIYLNLVNNKVNY